jgi:hypothetical protein
MSNCPNISRGAVSGSRNVPYLSQNPSPTSKLPKDQALARPPSENNFLIEDSTSFSLCAPYLGDADWHGLTRPGSSVLCSLKRANFLFRGRSKAGPERFLDFRSRMGKVLCHKAGSRWQRCAAPFFKRPGKILAVGAAAAMLRSLPGSLVFANFAILRWRPGPIPIRLDTTMPESHHRHAMRPGVDREPLERPPRRRPRPSPRRLPRNRLRPGRREPRRYGGCKSGSTCASRASFMASVAAARA